VKTLTLTPNPAPLSTETTNDSTDRPQFVCPLTLKEMNGVQPFVYLSTCGCVFSHAGLKTVAASSSPKEKDEKKGNDAAEPPLDLCPQCQKKYSSSEDSITINPTTEEEETMRFAMERKRLLEPSKKKSKKRKAEGAEKDEVPAAKKQALPSLNPAIAGANRAVVSELAMSEAKRKAKMSEAVKSLYGDGTKKKETFMTMGTFTRVSCQMLHV